MKYLLLIVIGLSFSAYSQNERALPKPTVQPIAIGESVELYSQELGENRLVNIYLPEGYSPDSTEKYPVIYVLDGGLDENFVHFAGLVQFGSLPTVNMMPRSIVIGIANVDRDRDFTHPPKNETFLNSKPSAGGSQEFMNFIEKELQPYVQSNYKVSKHRTIFGHSLAGLLATEVLITRSYLFDDYIVVSPSMWWDDKSLLLVEATVTDNPRLVLAYGNEAETLQRNTVDIYTKMKQFLIYGNIKLLVIEDQKHSDILHEAAYRALRELNLKPDDSTSPED